MTLYNWAYARLAFINPPFDSIFAIVPPSVKGSVDISFLNDHPSENSNICIKLISLYESNQNVVQNSCYKNLLSSFTIDNLAESNYSVTLWEDSKEVDHIVLYFQMIDVIRKIPNINVLSENYGHIELVVVGEKQVRDVTINYSVEGSLIKSMLELCIEVYN